MDQYIEATKVNQITAIIISNQINQIINKDQITNKDQIIVKRDK